MLEKLQTAGDEVGKNPANVQSKHQKDRVFETELEVGEVINDIGRDIYNQVLPNPAVADIAEKLISKSHSRSDEFAINQKGRESKSANLKGLLEQHKQNVPISRRVQQFPYDAIKAETWVVEEELYVMGKDCLLYTSDAADE